MVRWIGCVLLGWLALCMPAGASARSGDHEPVLLLFPPGGFIINVLEMPYAEVAARDLGFRPVFVDYPEYDLPGAVRSARAAARSAHRAGAPVYAYGESVGGTLASLLAEEDRVRAAAGYCPIANLVKLMRLTDDPAFYRDVIQATPRLLRRYSPGLHDTDRPVFALRARHDARTTNRAIRSWDLRDPSVLSIQGPGGHLRARGRPAVYRRNVEWAIGRLAGSAGLGSPAG